MAAGREPLSETLVIGGTPVALVVADLADPALAELVALPPTPQDLADAARPGASPRTFFHARRALTRRLVAGRAGVAPDTIVIGYDSPGAPRVLAPTGAGFVSVAGRGSLAAIAMANTPVGVDLEPLNAAVEPVWEVLHPDEATMLRALPAEDRRRPFLAIWTAKEAGLKALGDGFAREAASVSVRWSAVHQSPHGEGFRRDSGGSVSNHEGSSKLHGYAGRQRTTPLVVRDAALRTAPHHEGGGGGAPPPTFTLLSTTSAPLAHGLWIERRGALVAVALA